ncbi:YeaC family protein [Parathalassolituus penaei]|uniref:DUF1315 family protein n=1 Tax=Parathalassolituus penaei TaxID=2997323 RepID=A0A9X3IUP6_9GAMM|nr:DUF1315 family protein [Parathalassolituus penaei]MCY0966398.1 DUF1315 family protein [Parathalassolituus penaei]
MTLQDLIKSLTPEVYENLKNAVALGRWPNGVDLQPGQRELCMEALLHYEMLHDVPMEQRVGYVGGACSSGNVDKIGRDDHVQTLTIQ